MATNLSTLGKISRLPAQTTGEVRGIIYARRLPVTHSRHDQLHVPPGDVLVHAGDSTMNGGIPEIAAFNYWLRTLPHPHKIVIAGNHDWLFELMPALAESLITNAVYLRDSAITIEG